MAGLVSENYAMALLGMAEEVDKVELYKEQMKEIQDAIRSSSDLASIMLHPKVAKEDKKKILRNLFHMDQYIQNFVDIIIDKNRFGYFDDICTQYIAMANSKLNIEVADVTSAVKLDKKEIDGLIEMLRKKTGRRIEIIEHIDPSCIAGIRVKLKDMVMDNTLETRLNRIKRGVVKTAL